jgi:hypothetical protein
MFGMMLGIENGSHGRVPREQDVVAVLVRAEAADAGRDRRTDALRLFRNVDSGIVLGLRAAARIICANRSILRAALRSIQTVGSKSFSSQAKCTLYAGLE